ncbi:unnamed protein product [Adineta ricciae]|uniref:DUF6924 domain-containing protein n=1 Tax=Adineta ricciae TaxID=249248 RepID=A0A815ELP5_ADIRI|nr:unnamed protein product [Adineta ricciae]
MQQNNIFLIRTFWGKDTDEEFDCFQARLKSSSDNYYEFVQMGSKEQVNQLPPIEAYEWLKKNTFSEHLGELLVIFDETSSRDGSAVLLRIKPDKSDEHCQTIRSDPSRAWECNANLEICNMDWCEYVDWAGVSGGSLPFRPE